ncbi:MAG: helix-turn-helix domain-containing protein [Betaproteobacteria bacterium]|jgi:CRP/FNR family transcriptional regulator
MKPETRNDGEGTRLLDRAQGDAASARAAVGLEALSRLLGIELPSGGEFAEVTFQTRTVLDGEALLRGGDVFRNLYVVRAGSFKTALLDGSGTLQGMGFPMRGDAIGVDGLATGRHACEAIALERSEVVVIPAQRLSALSAAHPAFTALVNRLMGREIQHDQAVMFLLGSLGAEARVAAFLIDLSKRYSALGYSSTTFNLRMTRQDIGDYLGLNIETVSRVMSSLSQMGLVHIHHREVEILDPAGLRQLVADPSGLQRVRSRTRGQEVVAASQAAARAGTGFRKAVAA